jgi:hypothetical protein
MSEPKEKPKVDKREEREKRVEIGYLEVLISRYPEAARRFVRKLQTKQHDSQILIDT